MEKQTYFQTALANFTFDVASGGAIRHLADLDYTAAQIMKRLDFPTPFDQVQQTIWEHFLQTGILRLEEPGTFVQKENYEFVTEYDAYGRKSFRQVAVDSIKEPEIVWNEQIFTVQNRTTLAAYLADKCTENGEKTAYISCNFGLKSRREPANYKKMLNLLEESDREYLLGLPWERKLIYHRLNRRMRNIVDTLYQEGEYTGTCYFINQKEKLHLYPLSI